MVADGSFDNLSDLVDAATPILITGVTCQCEESRFTMHIQTERSWLGKNFGSSNRELLGFSRLHIYRFNMQILVIAIDAIPLATFFRVMV